MAMSPAGRRTETLRFERPVETRNAVGEVSSTTWVSIGRRRGSVEQVGYSETQDQGQTSGQASYLIVVPSVSGLDGSCRIVWESRLGRILVVSSVIGDGTDPEQTIQASEKKT
jgi:head-tail adaptor